MASIIDPPTPLTAPPEAMFDSAEEAYSAVLSWSKSRGYGVWKSRSCFDKCKPPTLRRIDVHCDKGPMNYSTQGNIRQTETKKCGCKFELRLQRDPTTRRWHLIIINGEHKDDHGYTHIPSDDAMAHPCHRKLSEQDRGFIIDDSKIAKPRFIKAKLLEQNAAMTVKLRDIYNAKAKFKRDRLGELTPVESLIEALQKDDDWAIDLQLDEQGRVHTLFFSHTSMIQMLRAHPDVLMVDCTYKTNRYNMPLLHFIGTTPIDTSFSAAFAFLPGEDQEHYDFVLAAFKKLVLEALTPEVVLTDNETALKNSLKGILPTTPQLLCYWHVQKNVLTQVQKTWKDQGASDDERESNKEQRRLFMNDFNDLMYSKDEEQFEQKWTAFQYSWREQPNLVNYMRNIQYPQRQEVSKAWASQIRHFGLIVTSRLEGQHGVAKSFMANSQGDLDDVIESLKKKSDVQLHEFKGEAATRRERLPDVIKPKNCPVLTQRHCELITSFALKKVAAQYTLFKEQTYNPVCTSQFTAIFGLPCVHSIAHLVSTHGSQATIPFSHFHQHWYFQRDDGPVLFIEPLRPPREPTVRPPLKVVTKGRPRRDEDRSTLRDPSQFEQGVRGGRENARGRGRGRGRAIQQQVTQVTRVTLLERFNSTNTASQRDRGRGTTAQGPVVTIDDDSDDSNYVTPDDLADEQQQDDEHWHHIDDYIDEIDLTASQTLPPPPPPRAPQSTPPDPTSAAAILANKKAEIEAEKAAFSAKLKALKVEEAKLRRAASREEGALASTAASRAKRTAGAIAVEAQEPRKKRGRFTAGAGASGGN
jgi:hypothetical protein